MSDFSLPNAVYILPIANWPLLEIITPEIANSGLQ